jgi:hypothetical protein
MTIVPDDKDWTWVLSRPCPECGLDTGEVPPGEVGPMLRANAERWLAVLAGADPARRPSPATWSPLEYACHVRDVFRIYDERLALMLTEDDPLFPNWDQDATAVADRYGEQDPAVVAAELDRAADILAGHFDQVTAEEWQRPGSRGDGATFTVATFARYFIHDPIHHLWDVTRP